MRAGSPRAAAAALLVGLLSLGLPGAAPARAQPGATPTAGRWTLAFVRADTFALELYWDDGTEWRRAIGFAELHGAAPRDIAASDPTPVTFRVERDAGDFEFEGSFYLGRGAGQFRYRPERRFADTLRALGVAELGAVRDHDLKSFAFGDISAEAIRELRALGVWPLRKRDLVSLAVRVVTPESARPPADRRPRSDDGAGTRRAVRAADRAWHF
jgi:hypothetical protein